MNSIGRILFWKKASGRVSLFSGKLDHTGAINNQINSLTECKRLLRTGFVAVPGYEQTAIAQSLNNLPITLCLSRYSSIIINQLLPTHLGRIWNTLGQKCDFHLVQIGSALKIAFIHLELHAILAPFVNAERAGTAGLLKKSIFVPCNQIIRQYRGA
ncbi:hypothetical protein D3C78_1189430 [compost metagenome]